MGEKNKEHDQQVKKKTQQNTNKQKTNTYMEVRKKWGINISTIVKKKTWPENKWYIKKVEKYCRN